MKMEVVGKGENARKEGPWLTAGGGPNTVPKLRATRTEKGTCQSPQRSGGLEDKTL